MDMIAISPTNVLFMAIVGIVLVVGPILAAVIACLRFRSGAMPVVIGILTYLLVQIVIRSPLLSLFYSIPGVEAFMTAHGILQDLFLSVTTAVIEECARWAVFFFVLKKHVNDYTAITYGIGHGGTEVAVISGIAYLNYYLTAHAINISFTEPFDAEIMEELAQASVSIAAIAPREMFLTILTQAAAVCMHVMYTFIIARGVRYNTTKITLPLAIGMHFLYLFFSALLLRLPDGVLWQALFCTVTASACVYYLLEARRRSVMAEYEAQHK